MSLDIYMTSVYIYIYRERERERYTAPNYDLLTTLYSAVLYYDILYATLLYTYTYTYTYAYTYTYTYIYTCTCTFT